MMTRLKKSTIVISNVSEEDGSASVPVCACSIIMVTVHGARCVCVYVRARVSAFHVCTSLRVHRRISYVNTYSWLPRRALSRLP